MLRLYDNAVSGNCYKIRLLLAHLGREYERVEVDVVDRKRRAEQLGGKTPFFRIPLLELPDGRRIAESNAILWWLAEGTPYLPEDPWERLQVLQWLFFEQNQLEVNVGLARYWLKILGRGEDFAQALVHRQKAGRAALAVMDDVLASRPFVASDRYTIADISLFAYAHLAEEGNIALADFPNVGAWFERIRSQPGFVGM